MNKVTFFNHFHNGDLHISREFVRKVIDKVHTIDRNITFTYAHVNDPNLLSDIPGLGYENLNSLGLNQFENLTTRGDTVFFNTWYAQQNYRYMNVHGMTLDCLYEAFNDSCKALWNFGMEDLSHDPSVFIPTIDYSKFYIQEAQNWLNQNPQKKIFVSNGAAMSGQATNFPMAPLISDLAQIHQDKLFILSNQEGQTFLPPNVIYSKDIIKKPAGSDLNENGFLTNYCDVIVGRASGAFTYAWTQYNMLQRPAKFVCFCGPGVVIRPPNQFWLSTLLNNKIHYSAEYTVSDTTDGNTVKKVIESVMHHP